MTCQICGRLIRSQFYQRNAGGGIFHQQPSDCVKPEAETVDMPKISPRRAAIDSKKSPVVN